VPSSGGENCEYLELLPDVVSAPVKWCSRTNAAVVRDFASRSSSSSSKQNKSVDSAEQMSRQLTNNNSKRRLEQCICAKCH